MGKLSGKARMVTSKRVQQTLQSIESQPKVHLNSGHPDSHDKIDIDTEITHIKGTGREVDFLMRLNRKRGNSASAGSWFDGIRKMGTHCKVSTTNDRDKVGQIEGDSALCWGKVNDRS